MKSEGQTVDIRVGASQTGATRRGWSSRAARLRRDATPRFVNQTTTDRYLHLTHSLKGFRLILIHRPLFGGKFHRLGFDYSAENSTV